MYYLLCNVSKTTGSSMFGVYKIGNMQEFLLMGGGEVIHSLRNGHPTPTKKNPLANLFNLLQSFLQTYLLS